MKTLINALMIGSLLTTAAFAGDAPAKKDAPAAKTDAKATDAKKTDDKAPATDAKKADDKAAPAKDAKDAKKPATK